VLSIDAASGPSTMGASVPSKSSARTRPSARSTCSRRRRCFSPRREQVHDHREASDGAAVSGGLCLLAGAEVLSDERTRRSREPPVETHEEIADPAADLEGRDYDSPERAGNP